MKIFENWVQYYLWVWKYLMFKCLNCSNWMRLKQLTFVDSAQLTSFTEQRSKIDFYHFQFFVVVQPSNKQQLSSQSPCTFVRQFFKSPCTFMKITLYNIIQQLARIILMIAFIFIMFTMWNVISFVFEMLWPCFQISLSDWSSINNYISSHISIIIRLTSLVLIILPWLHVSLHQSLDFHKYFQVSTCLQSNVSMNIEAHAFK